MESFISDMRLFHLWKNSSFKLFSHLEPVLRFYLSPCCWIRGVLLQIPKIFLAKAILEGSRMRLETCFSRVGCSRIKTYQTSYNHFILFHVDKLMLDSIQVPWFFILIIYFWPFHKFHSHQSQHPCRVCRPSGLTGSSITWRRANRIISTDREKIQSNTTPSSNKRLSLTTTRVALCAGPDNLKPYTDVMSDLDAPDWTRVIGLQRLKI